MLLGINGTLMRGLQSNFLLQEVQAMFICEGLTSPIYRLWSIHDQYPGMIRVRPGQSGTKIALEIWEVSADGLHQVLLHEPDGLALGRIILDNEETILGIIAEPYIIEGMTEITQFGGWRSYQEMINSKGLSDLIPFSSRRKATRTP